MTIGVGGMDVGKVSDGAIEKARTKGPKVDKGFLDMMKKAASGAEQKNVDRGRNLKEKALSQLDRDTRARFFKDKEAFADSNSIKADNKPKLFREFLKRNAANLHAYRKADPTRLVGLLEGLEPGDPLKIQDIQSEIQNTTDDGNLHTRDTGMKYTDVRDTYEIDPNPLF